ncbi:hypothetical protein ACH41E_00310 [Streptomyces sp. NPDC020412]|uniref:hypothetical protein n=1 Tax=Streptomyces sp. NPDC020412 TaxID=3365073 RepID=UPI0037AD2188
MSVITRLRPRRRQAAAVALLSALALTATACSEDKAGGAKAAAEAAQAEGAGKGAKGAKDAGDQGGSTAPAEKSSGGADDPFGGKSDDEVVAEALQVTTDVSSVTIGFDGMMDDPDLKGRMTGEMSIHDTGQCVGAFAFEDKGKMDLAVIGKDVYLRPDDKMLRTQMVPPGTPKAEADPVLKLFRGKWMKGSSTDPDMKDMAEFCDLDKMFKELRGDSSGTGSDPGSGHRGEETVVNGQKAVPFVDSKGYTGYIASEGKPYILKMTDPSEDAEMETVTLSNFGSAPLPTVPSPDKVLDLEKLEEGARKSV